MKEAQFNAMIARWDKVLSDNDKIMGKMKPRVVFQRANNVDETGYPHRSDAGGFEMKRRGW